MKDRPELIMLENENMVEIYRIACKGYCELGIQPA